MVRMVFVCNWPAEATPTDAVQLLAPFGDIVKAQVSDEPELAGVLPHRRRRPTEPAAAIAAGRVSTGKVALVEYEEEADADVAAENIDGAVYRGHELIVGVVKQ